MNEPNIRLTNTEWNLMECLWETSPRTGRETTDYLQKYVGWTRSTTLTMLRRMHKALSSLEIVRDQRPANVRQAAGFLIVPRLYTAGTQTFTRKCDIINLHS